jgi:cardiolipin synthase A/B
LPAAGRGIARAASALLALPGWLGVAAGLMVLAVQPPPARAATPADKARTVGELKDASERGVPRAFVRGNNVRIYYAIDGRPVVFKAGWKSLPIEGLDYRYRQAELKYDQAPPRLPKVDSSWQEAVIFNKEQWNRLAREAAERLTLTEPWRGTFLQLLDSESVFYRDAAGRVHAVPADRKPPQVQMVRRYNAQEFSVTMTRVLESTLEEGSRGQRWFLLEDPHEGQVIRFMLLDLERRSCVLLYAPRTGDRPTGGPKIGSTVRSIGSLLVESHGLAIIKNPVSSVGRLVNRVFQGLLGLVPSGSGQRKQPLPPVADQPGMDLAAWEQRLDKLSGRRSDWGTFRLLINGEQFFPAFERRLAEATNHIDLLVCIFDRDDVAVNIADQLRERSKEVDVRVVLDRMSSLASGNSPPATPMREGFVPPSSIGSYLEGGSRVRVRPFLNPWFSADHSKLFLVDGQHAFVGGMNLGREYRYEWHDLMVELEGPIVARFQRDFERSWAHASLLGDLAYAENALFAHKPPRVAEPPAGMARIRRLYTRTGDLQIRRAFMEALNRAQRCVYLENTYFYDSRVLEALVRARRRGVDVRVVLSSESDFGGADSSNYIKANRLFRNGARVFLYPGMTHVKAAYVDGWVCLGSANLNKLSLRFNQEINIATSDPRIAAQVEQELFAVDFSKSHELTEPIRVSWTDHLAESILEQF